MTDDANMEEYLYARGRLEYRQALLDDDWETIARLERSAGDEFRPTDAQASADRAAGEVIPTARDTDAISQWEQSQQEQSADFNDGVWRYAVGADDLVVDGVVYNGQFWEQDGEGSVQPREGYTSQETLRSDFRLDNDGHPEPLIGWDAYHAQQGNEEAWLDEQIRLSNIEGTNNYYEDLADHVARWRAAGATESELEGLRDKYVDPPEITPPPIAVSDDKLLQRLEHVEGQLSDSATQAAIAEVMTGGQPDPKVVELQEQRTALLQELETRVDSIVDEPAKELTRDELVAALNDPYRGSQSPETLLHTLHSPEHGLTLGVTGNGDVENALRRQRALDLLAIREEWERPGGLREPFALTLLAEHGGDVAAAVRDDRLRDAVIRYRSLDGVEGTWPPNLANITSEVEELRAKFDPDSREALTRLSDEDLIQRFRENEQHIQDPSDFPDPSFDEPEYRDRWRRAESTKKPIIEEMESRVTERTGQDASRISEDDLVAALQEAPAAEPDTATPLPDNIARRLREGHARDLAAELDKDERRDFAQVRAMTRGDQAASFRGAVAPAFEDVFPEPAGGPAKLTDPQLYAMMQAGWDRMENYPVDRGRQLPAAQFREAEDRYNRLYEEMQRRHEQITGETDLAPNMLDALRVRAAAASDGDLRPASEVVAEIPRRRKTFADRLRRVFRGEERLTGPVYSMAQPRLIDPADLAHEDVRFWSPPAAAVAQEAPPPAPDSPRHRPRL